MNNKNTKNSRPHPQLSSKNDIFSKAPLGSLLLQNISLPLVFSFIVLEEIVWFFHYYPPLPHPPHLIH
jgi:hypothetical protein